MSELLIANGTVITLGEKNKIIPQGAVLVKDKLIAEVGYSAELVEKYPAVRRIDAQKKIIMPGMINTHMHLYSTFARGIGLTGQMPSNFVEILEKLWWRLDKVLTEEDIYYSALIPLIDGIRCGTTTIIDHHASPHAVDGSLDQIACALEKTGVRGCLCYEVSDRDGQEIAEKGIRENERFIKKANTEKNDLISGMFGLHASFTVSDKTLDKCAEIGSSLNSGFHLHVAEDQADVDECLKKHGQRIAFRLQKHNILGEKTLAIHCIHVNRHEMELFKETNTKVIHNPESNMNNGVGCAKVPLMLERGLAVGLGTDGFTADMFTELRTALLVHKLESMDNRAMSYNQLYQLCFINSPRIASLFFNHAVGEIAEGNYADIIIVDYLPPTPLTADNFVGHLIFGLSTSTVDTTIINGKPVMIGRKLEIDEEDILSKSNELTKKLWQRFAEGDM